MTLFPRLYPGVACVSVSSSLPYPPHPLNLTLPYEANLVAFGYFRKCGTVFNRRLYGAVRYIHLVSPDRTLMDFCALSAHVHILRTLDCLL